MIAALARRKAPGKRGRGGQPTMLAALAPASFLVVSFLAVFDDTAVTVALPSLQRDLRLDLSGAEGQV